MSHSARESRGTRRTRGLRRMRGTRWLRRLRGMRCLRRMTGLMWLLDLYYNTMGIGYTAMWGFGAKCLSGVGEWMDGYPLDCYDYWSTCS